MGSSDRHVASFGMYRTIGLGLVVVGCSARPGGGDIEVTFDHAPPAISNQRHVAFGFHIAGGATRVRCTLDAGDAVPCTTPFAVDVGDGAHVFTVTATGDALVPGDAAHAWQVDTSPPDTSLALAPPAFDPASTTSLTFASAAPDVDHFECALDAAAFTRCSSPAAITVEDGTHTFQVRAIDAAGNADPSPAQVTWSADTTAPIVTFLSGPVGPVDAAQATFAFSANVVDTACALDAAAFAACASPVTTPALADGPHVFAVRASDVAGNTVTVSRAFVVDTTGPSIAITSGPDGPTANATPTWTFTVAGEAVAVQCRIDSDALADCASGTFTAAPLAGGPHVFEVQAQDAVGNLGTAQRAIEVDTSACGDGVVDASRGEACDGANLDGQSCGSVGNFDGGTLGCTAGCQFDTSACRRCGNGVVEGPEQCDAADLAGASCATLGFTAGSLACSATCTLDPSGCGVCGDGVAQSPEVCDAADLKGATCTSLGLASGTLACAAGCGGYDTTGCTGAGGYVAANAGFTGRPCFDGLRYSTPNLTLPYALACTEDHGVFKTTLGAPLTWTDVNPGGVTNLHGRAVATNPNGPPVYFITDPSTPNNAFRSNTAGDTWIGQAIADAGTPRDLFAFSFRQQVGNIAGSWDATLGATVLHGSTPALVPHFVGPSPGSVTGTVRAIASGGAKDVYVAVYGQTPAGAPANGGIYRACDLTMTGGGTYVERDAGIDPADLGRVWSITADPASVVSSTFACGAVTASGFATTYYAALRGGGQIYKTSDGGATWSLRNTGLAAGAEVYVIAIDCFSGTTASMCQDHTLLYAATSAGLYRSSDAGDHWTLDGFAGQVVRAVALHPTASPPQLLVGVDDAVGIYQSL